MDMHALLRKIGLVAGAPQEADADQIYSEAVLDDALHNNEKTIERLADISEVGRRTNARLVAGIERMKIASADSGELMAGLVRGTGARRQRH